MLMCFDLGEILVRVAPNWSVALGRMVEEGDWSDLERDNQTGHLDRQSFLSAMASRLNASVEEVASAHDGWIQGEMEGAESLLVDLKSAGHTIAFLSNTCACHWEAMQRWPIFRHVKHPHASHLLGAFKPDLAIYEAFAKAVQCAPKDIMFFDDRRPNIEAAAALGWQVMHVPAGPPPIPRIRHMLGSLGLL
ncbi:MAG: HAD-IA family hydrolase [Planctomycetota bacterium]|nr:HAD-IA family hydrolase [Planctomycetota bacterium]MEC8855571.1 HAD-IA family hydrolase [Planctomycetota bacterium]